VDSDDDRIVLKVKARAADPSMRADMELPPDPIPLADPLVLERIEAELGFSLPALLKRLYLEVGDGNFGPGVGLFGAASGHWMSDEPCTLADLYRCNHKGNWPDGLVPICDWGCAIWSCIDCNREEFPMVISDPNEGPSVFIPERINFSAWIEAWADGVDLMDRRTGDWGPKAFGDGADDLAS
jgi:hypothetical protein